jgi:hypothetical protein
MFHFSLYTRYTVTAPKGTISERGIEEVTKFIQAQRLSSDEWREANPNIPYTYLYSLPVDWDWTWVVQKGEYAGTLPKRISKYYFKVYNIKCPESFLSQIGNIARAHSEDNLQYEFDFVDKFDWESGDFGDSHSCFWGSKEEARDILHENGALAVRFYKDGAGSARAWLYKSEEFLLVFNGYGYLTLHIARVLSLHFNVSYKKIRLTNYNRDDGTLWINGGTGYLVGTLENIESMDEFDLEWGDDYLRCYDCGEVINDYNSMTGADDELYCEHCFYNRFDSCSRCGETFYQDDIYYIHEDYYCEHCADRYFTTCVDCGEYITHQEAIRDSEGLPYCENCYTPPADEEETSTE